jgi:hypothetical protein
MGSTSDPKRRSGNANTFARYLSDIQDNIANTWRITPEVVAQYQGIANFRATRHNMWIQAHRDPEKEWLQLRFCINAEEVEMEMRDWQDDWKIPVITKDMPKGKEVEAGSSKTPAGDNIAPKNQHSRGSPVKIQCNRRREVLQRRMHRSGKKDTAPTQEEQGRGDTMTQETPSTATPQETGPPKWPIIHTGGSCKKAKAHKKSQSIQSPRMMSILSQREYRITQQRSLKRLRTKEEGYIMSWSISGRS